MVSVNSYANNISAVSVLVVFLVKNNGAYPTGSDTMYHIFRGDYVYNSIKEGSWYPIYNSMWYNGVEIMRYWAPLTAYYMALCQMIAGGGQLAGYLIFVGSVCFFNSILWLIIGRKMNKYILVHLLDLYGSLCLIICLHCLLKVILQDHCV